MRVIILTESSRGTAAHHLPFLLNCPQIEIVQVVKSKGQKLNRKKHLISKIKKAIAIGPLGVINGFRMRKWFGENIDRHLNLEDLEQICKRNNIRFAVTDMTNSQMTMDLFTAANADIGVSLGNGFISKKIFSIPALGMINIHHEILPEYQNAQSIIWQLYNYSSYTGYTIHAVTSKIDGGDIVYQEKLPIIFKKTLSETITATSISLLKASAEGLVRLLQNYSTFIREAKPQGAATSYTTPSGRQLFRILKNFNRLKRENGV